ARDHRYVSDPSDGSTYHVWVEDREIAPGNPRSIVFAQKVDKDGVPRWSNNGVAVNAYRFANAVGFATDVEKPDICVNGNGGAWVIWKQYTLNTDGKYAQRYECPMFGLNSSGAFWTAGLLGYTWSENASTCTSPRILSDGAGGGVYGVIRESGPDFKPFVGKFNNFGGAMGEGFIVTSPAVQPGEELHISYDGSSNVFALTRSTGIGQIVVGYLNHTVLPPASDHATIPYTDFDSYDLLHQDYLLSTGSAALFTYAISSAAGEPFNVHVGLYRPGTTVFTAPVTTHTAGSGFSATQPAISPDSTINPATGEQGVLLAWNTYRNTPPVPPHHRVESNRYTLTSGMYPGYTMATEFPVPLILEDGLGVAAHPDIARVFSSTATQAPRAVVVWEGGGETSPCSPPRPTDIRGQFVLYDASAPNAGPQWTTPEMIAPGPGNYHQTRPVV
ncbi:MAG TPA: hypothetical protein PK916_18085, partial [Bacteroidota bacterium]|nr:hypothetical protein [Bacteroidota bacterium]